jgi:hypothetical protein
MILHYPLTKCQFYPVFLRDLSQGRFIFQVGLILYISVPFSYLLTYRWHLVKRKLPNQATGQLGFMGFLL